MRDYSYALALGELYRREQIGVFKYSFGKPKFGNFIIKIDRNLKNLSIFLTYKVKINEENCNNWSKPCGHKLC